MRRTRPIRFWLGGTRRRCTCRGRETSSRRASGSITASDRVSCTRVPAFHHLLQGHQPDYCFHSHLKSAFFFLFFCHPRRSRSDCRDERTWLALVKLTGKSFLSGVQTCQILRTDATVPGGFGELTVEFSAATTRQLITVHCAGISFT